MDACCMYATPYTINIIQNSGTVFRACKESNAGWENGEDATPMPDKRARELGDVQDLRLV